jgi:hypothetical protein
MNHQNPVTESGICIANRCTSGLMGIADWMEETGQQRKANALRALVIQLDSVVGELAEQAAQEQGADSG